MRIRHLLAERDQKPSLIFDNEFVIWRWTMALPPPEFLREAGAADAVAEFRVFMDRVGEPAVYLLAELAAIHNGKATASPEDAKRTGVRNLRCRTLKNWAVFYSLSAGNCVTVVHVASLNVQRFAALVQEAESRLRRAEL